MTDFTLPWLMCPRCGVRISGGNVYFTHRPNPPSTGDVLARKVCQWAYAADLRQGTISEGTPRARGCINPVYDINTSYEGYDTLPILPFNEH